MPTFLPAGVGALLGEGAGGDWRDRVEEAAYRSPNGTRIRFLFEDVQRQTTKRGTVYEFPGINDAYIQRKGFGPRRYPMRCYFAGADHDLVATAFEVALLEDGIGKLDHPRYGTLPRVVPFGDITRRDDLKTAANQTIIDVTFWTTLASIYPSAQRDAESEIRAALGTFDVELAQELAAGSFLTEAHRRGLKATIRGGLREVSAELRKVADATDSVRREFDDYNRLINESIDVLIGQPLTLGRQVNALIKAPARALSSIQARLDGYATLYSRLLGLEASSPSAAAVSGTSAALTKAQNDFRAQRLMVLDTVAGSVESTLEHEFSTKPEALDAAEQVLDLFDNANAWSDSGLDTLGIVDTGAAYQALRNAVAFAAGNLVAISFQLVPERAIVLDRPRTIIDLAAELYGAVDDRLDLLINSNHLSGDEILELPMGKRIVYYPTAA